MEAYVIQRSDKLYVKSLAYCQEKITDLHLCQGTYQFEDVCDVAPFLLFHSFTLLLKNLLFVNLEYSVPSIN